MCVPNEYLLVGFSLLKTWKCLGHQTCQTIAHKYASLLYVFQTFSLHAQMADGILHFFALFCGSIRNGAERAEEEKKKKKKKKEEKKKEKEKEEENVSDLENVLTQNGAPKSSNKE